MNIVAGAIASGVGGLFFAAASVFYYQPSFIKPDELLGTLLTTNQSKARAAVSRLLINPSSAEFEGLRSVEADAAKYVCGSVKAKDRTGAYAGHRAFVYTVSNDFARIDDDGTIAQRHVAYRACPVSVEEEKIAQQKITISPGALQAVKAIQGALPAAADTSVLSSLSGTASGAAAGGGTMQQLAGQTGAGASSQQGGGAFRTSSAKPQPGDEAAWRADRPPAAWPSFPPDHALAKPAPKRSNADALALARTIETRWNDHKSDRSRPRPSAEDVQDALRALLALDPKGPDFPQAWAIFVRLRALERDTAG